MAQLIEMTQQIADPRLVVDGQRWRVDARVGAVYQHERTKSAAEDRELGVSHARRAQHDGVASPTHLRDEQRLVLRRLRRVRDENAVPVLRGGLAEAGEHRL